MLASPSTLLASAALLVASCSAIALPHFIDPRAPHFAEILEPQPDFVLRANGSSNDTLVFQYRNGEKADETTMTISLINGNDTYILASNVTFNANWYTVNTTISIVYAQIPDGNYTLSAAELLDGDILSEVQQPFGISHNLSSPAPTGEMSLVDPNAASSTSAYIYQPSDATASQSQASVSSPSSSGGSNDGSQATQTSLPLTREANPTDVTQPKAATPEQEGGEENDTIGEVLQDFVEGVGQ